MKYYRFTKGAFSPVEGLSPSNRGFAYADGFFESMLCLEGEPTFWDVRVKRMHSTLAFLKMDGLALDDLRQSMQAVLSAHHKPITRLRLTIYRDGNGRYLPESNVAGVVMSVEDLDTSPFHSIPSQTIGVSSVRLSTLPDGNHKLLAKHTQVRAALEAKEQGLDDLIMLNAKDEVSEMIAGNLFAVVGNEVLTPGLTSGCLDGVARRVLLELPHVREVRLTMDHIQEADALFSANSVVGLIALQYASIPARLDLMHVCKEYLAQRMH